MKKTTYVLALAAAAVLVLAAAATSLVLINGGLFASGTENRIESAAKQMGGSAGPSGLGASSIHMRRKANHR